MSDLPDNLLISEINIPGSHNAAAINTTRRTRWACQDRSITAQLAGGIRLLDIRLKPKKLKPKKRRETQNPYTFITCHGRLGLPGANEFQPLDELFAECTAFLTANPTETLIITIKIDDWRRSRAADRTTILETLQTYLAPLPIIRATQLPTLGVCRGKIYLINRINDDPALGIPLNIPDNTPGSQLPSTTNRHYVVYVQDQYKGLDRINPEAHKLDLTMAAIKHKRPGTVLINFASATKPIGRFVYIMRELLEHFRDPAIRPSALGWLFLDYAFTADLPTLIIASNY